MRIQTYNVLKAGLRPAHHLIHLGIGGMCMPQKTNTIHRKQIQYTENKYNTH
jgi:hypothetical protein